jgi:predicted ABC-type ATPase
MQPILDARPIVVALAGPNGAGKTTFYNAYLRPSGLRFVNADEIGVQTSLDSYKAAAFANALRGELVKQRESFVFETVFSDPVGDKLSFLKDAADSGYAVVLIYIGIADTAISEERVAMRISQGGHDVPSGKLQSRFARTLANLKSAIDQLPLVLVYDNSDLSTPFKKVAEYQQGVTQFLAKPLPDWLAKLK